MVCASSSQQLLRHSQDQVLALAEVLRATCVAIWQKAGLPPADAGVATDALVEANLRGIDFEGVSLLPMYVRRIQLGLTNPRPKIVAVRETAATALLDGDHGQGHVVATQAMKRAMALAKRSGVGLVGVRRSSHFGMAGYYAIMALEQDMVGLVADSGRATMPPWGGVEPRITGSPIAVAVPAGQERPVVLDMALSSSARGRVKEFLARGEPLPTGWATDRLGQPTTDPAVALKGFLTPIGGPKGYALALITNLVAGVLMGGPFAWQVGSVYDDLDRPQDVAHLLMAISVEAFMPVQEFKVRVDELIREVRATPKAPGAERIYLPGEMEFECREKRLQEGIPLPRSLWAELQTMAG